MKIALAKESDILEIQKIATQSWQENYQNIISQEQIDYMLHLMYNEKELQNHFQNENYSYFFIENESEMRIGIMGVEINTEEKSTKLHRLYLLKSEKGKGFGKLAIEFLKNWVKEKENSRIILNVNKFNPAKEFYLKNGFSVYSEGIFDIGNSFVMDDYLMEFVLS
ncbi:GNAT family N-acetyltransferase [Frigoriflavimonas asaccharolytica]|uniref:GNAT superfamily N-acetyltransferase n=1 Tax=Frigoriflavimonas asaccharolytica TaxID=2735899 RepID=A0A8J8K520_9FLAO|nr:GNAT family N-acetyltransferase [Frigoriflavimonas asaccharolytica]NRS92355.1 GNAT superfamily N-acetyltransferase [Frigoriflavimonas asaccharolytica]